jgi:general secretion pathway protein G
MVMRTVRGERDVVIQAAARSGGNKEEVTMKRSRPRGFSLVEILIVLGLMGILATVVLMNFGNSDRGTKEQTLKSNLTVVRQALDVYKSDHGWYPCDPADWNSAGNAANFIRQMTEYTSATGQPSTTRTSTFKYGPYLKSWPVEPMSKISTVTVNTTQERLLATIGAAVAASGATGGWYYEARSGNFCGNLGSTFPPEYARY